ncbi:MAG: hypothetical protein HOH33_01455 [Verrucomicrobia bacterium]|nr:hypothetical protein [Verrucomicrobiota bacterium]
MKSHLELNGMNIVSTLRYPRSLWLLVVLFCGVGIWCLSIFFHGVTYGMPYSGKHTFIIHLTHMNGSQCREGRFSLESTGFAIGCCLLVAELSGSWNQNQWFKRGMTLFTPLLIVWAGNGHTFALLMLPIYILAALLASPILSFELFFGQINGDFFVDGDSTMLLTGFWGILCSCLWFSLHLKRRGLIFSENYEEVLR